jgi:hypothetical protein
MARGYNASEGSKSLELREQAQKLMAEASKIDANDAQAKRAKDLFDIPLTAAESILKKAKLEGTQDGFTIILPKINSKDSWDGSSRSERIIGASTGISGDYRNFRVDATGKLLGYYNDDFYNNDSLASRIAKGIVEGTENENWKNLSDSEYKEQVEKLANTLRESGAIKRLIEPMVKKAQAMFLKSKESKDEFEENISTLSKDLERNMKSVSYSEGRDYDGDNAIAAMHSGNSIDETDELLKMAIQKFEKSKNSEKGLSKWEAKMVNTVIPETIRQIDSIQPLRGKDGAIKPIEMDFVNEFKRVFENK